MLIDERRLNEIERRLLGAGDKSPEDVFGFDVEDLPEERKHATREEVVAAAKRHRLPLGDALVMMTLCYEGQAEPIAAKFCLGECPTCVQEADEAEEAARLAEDPEKAVVYFLAPEGRPELVKIGFTIRGIEERLSQMQIGSPEKLEVLHHIETSASEARALEAEFHARWDAHRVRGEWFRVEGELAEFLSRPAFPQLAQLSR